MSERVGPFDVKYEQGHSYKETWERRDDVFCPHCASATVWVETGGGDYYEGPRHMCSGCGWTWSMPRLHAGDGWQDEQRLAALRGAQPEASTASESLGD